MKKKKKYPKIIEKKLGREKAHGLAWDDGVINLDPRLKGRHRLKILIHEICHHIWPKMSETEVTKKSGVVSNILWDQGYRRADNYKR
jgi:hypothetical protein